MAWTRERVRDELVDAMGIIVRAPDPVKSMLKAQPRHRIVRDANESYGYDDPARGLPPTDKDIEWAEERVRWTRWLDAQTCKFVRLRALLKSWEFIKKADIPRHRSRGTLSKTVNAGLDEIARRLNALDEHRRKNL